MLMKRLAAMAALLLTGYILSGCAAMDRAAHYNDPPKGVTEFSARPTFSPLKAGEEATCWLEIRSMSGDLQKSLVVEVALGKVCRLVGSDDARYWVQVGFPEDIKGYHDPNKLHGVHLLKPLMAASVGGMVGGMIFQSADGIIGGAAVGAAFMLADIAVEILLPWVYFELKADVTITERVPKATLQKAAVQKGKGKQAAPAPKMVWEKGKEQKIKMYILTAKIKYEPALAKAVIEQRLADGLAALLNRK